MPVINNQSTQKNKPYILLVEDDPAISQMYETKLSSSGYNVRVEKDGEAGWQALLVSPRPEVLLLDIVLPRRDGYDILRDLRHHPTLHDLKVILLTNLTQAADKKEAEKLGADAYLVKAHIAFDELIKEIEKLRLQNDQVKV